MTERLQAIAARAVRQWGKHKQLRQLTEECGELVAAVNRLERGRITLCELADEVADVHIMIAQAKLMLGHEFDEALEAKLDRLELRLVHAEQKAAQP